MIRRALKIQKAGQELMNKYKGGNAGLPFWLILNPKGEVLADSFDAKGEKSGITCDTGRSNHFHCQAGKASKLSNEESQIIEKVF